MATFFQFLKQHKLPSRTSLDTITARPLSWYGVLFYILFGAILVTLYILILVINHRFTTPIAAKGGSITEGMIGSPHVINPILATTKTDIDLTALIYSGLTKKNDDGSYVADLAESYTVSSDGQTYTFTLPEKAKWSDGKPLTSTDVAFTISKLTDPALQTNGDWSNISIETPDTRTAVFHLTKADDNFLALVSVGIIPEHVWSDIPDEAFESALENIKGVGSGPYKVTSVSKNHGVVEKLVLTRNKHYNMRANIDTYNVDFFANQQLLLAALGKKSIDFTAAATPDTASFVDTTNYSVTLVASPAIAALYASDTTSSLSTDMINAINQSVDKAQILAIVDHGYGILPSSPTPSTVTLPASFAVAVESDNLSLAQAFANELEQKGTSVVIKSFDHGAFQDAIAAQTYPLYIGTSPEHGYRTAITFYTKAYPFLTKPSVHLLIPTYLDSLVDRYMHVADWHTRVNNVWKPFTNGISNNT